MPPNVPLFTLVMHVQVDSPRVARAISQIFDQHIGFDTYAELILFSSAAQQALTRESTFPHSADLLARHADRVRVVPLDSRLEDPFIRGAEIARGRFLSVLGATDQFDLGTLGAVRDRIDARRGTPEPVLAVPLVRGLRDGTPHVGYAELAALDAHVDVSDLPASVPTVLAGLFIDVAYLRARPELLVPMIPYDEPRHALELLEAVRFRFGFVRHDAARLASGGRIDPKLDPPDEYRRLVGLIEYFERLAARTEGLNPAERSVLIALLKMRLSRMSAEWFADDPGLPTVGRSDGIRSQTDLQTRVRALLQHVPPKELHESRWVRGLLQHQYLLASYAYAEHPWSLGADGNVRYRGVDVFSVSEFPVQVMRVNTSPGQIEIEAIFLDYHVGDLDLRLVADDGESAVAVEAASGDDGPAPRVAGRYPTRVHARRFVIPTKARSWRFAFASPAFDTVVRAERVAHHAKTAFSRNPESRCIIAKGYHVSYRPQRGFVVERGSRNPIIYRLRRALEHAREFGSVPWSVLASRHRKTVILINDRAAYGNDNGEALFRYIQEHRPDLRRRTWFVLDAAAPGYAELARSGRVVQPLTFKHRVLYLNARLHFSSHVPATYNSPWRGEETSILSDIADPTFIWLRHGVTMNSVDNIYNRFNANLDGIVASARYELEYLSRPGSFFNERSLIPSGLPRFDRLCDAGSDQSPRVLLYMPTWRKWLAGRVQPNGSREEVPGFLESEYFRQQQRLLTDSRVLDALRTANARIEFLIHPVMGAYQEHYRALASDQVAILDPARTSYADLLARGAGLVTDYSSVFVDFSYMRKPVLFDQSDVEQFRGGHYQQGLFDYATQAPGLVLASFEHLRDAVILMIESDFAVPDAYANRLDELFLHADHANSERALEGGIRIDERRRGIPFSAR
ncbi:CDP-glycerol glycerophosphotransferase family protein [Leucobacter sp. NPDC077196]|uniref:CDP-glycerol glycerophosphotransferase family protein n=1 Tax=Leucobacter sp. NPDC077196 TaxID=3154959 RepID=UPI00343734DD